MQSDPQQAICMNDWKATDWAIFGGTLLFRKSVKNRIIEILFYYILIKAHFDFPLFKIRDSKCSLGLVQQSCRGRIHGWKRRK
jgi:hypothetical protein